MTLREVERFGDVSLSVQASSMHYSTPRVDGLSLDQYTHVEIGLQGPKEKVFKFVPGPPIKSNLCLPSEIGIVGFDHLFDKTDAPVAPYVAQEDVERLREALRARAASFGKTECESCGGPHQHTDPDGGTFCYECVAESDYECAQEQEMIDALREAYEG